MPETDGKQESQREVAAQIADDLPFRIVEEMGLGLTFRSCSCGQLPCARLRPIRDALKAARDTSGQAAATRMREACVDAIKTLRATPHGAAYNNAINDAIHKVESLTLEQGEQEKQ